MRIESHREGQGAITATCAVKCSKASPQPLNLAC